MIRFLLGVLPAVSENSMMKKVRDTLKKVKEIIPGM